MGYFRGVFEPYGNTIPGLHSKRMAGSAAGKAVFLMIRNGIVLCLDIFPNI